MQSEKLVSSYPRDPRARLYRSAVLLEARDFDGTVRELRIALDEQDILRNLLPASFEPALQMMLAATLADRASMYRQNGDLDRALADYNEIIKIDIYALKLDPKTQQSALKIRPFYQRALILFRKGDLDRAIADFDQAIRLNPDYAAAFVGRGDAYSSREDYDRAIADYSEAIRLDPNNIGVYRARGYANAYAARNGAAAIDLARAVQEQPDNAYPVLWLYLSRMRSGDQSAISELESNVAKLKPTEWPYAVVELFLGRRTPEATLAAAGKPDERCEAQFYIGAWHLSRGDRGAATEPLRAASDTCPKTFVEYAGAQAELKRLGQ